MQETGCPPATSKSNLRFETVNFARIPAQSKLFLQYQSDPLSLRKYYPNVVASHLEISSRASEVLNAYTIDRAVLCEILEDQNLRFKAGSKTFENIARLQRDDTVAVLTGQQAGLLTGPLYTIYKALSAMKMANCLSERGQNAVPVFWAATEDHDFDEIARTVMLDSTGDPTTIEIASDPKLAGNSVGGIAVPKSFEAELSRLLDSLPDSEFKGSVAETLKSIWSPGAKIGTAFCSHIQKLFENYGLIVVDPLDPRLKKLASPIYSQAVRRSEETVAALVDRSKELKSDGFEPQVLVTPDYFPLFYHTDDGVRRSVRRKDDRTYRVTDTKIEFSNDEISQIALAEPDRLSPGVMLRPVVQDYLFPTICYFGGGAEISYFAQNSEVYRILERPATTILHRQSYTIVEAKHARTLEKYELDFTDLFAGFESVLPGIVERFVNPSTSRLFADAEDDINLELNKLDQEISRIDPTLAANLAKRRPKIMHHISAVRNKFHRAQIERDEVVNRQLRTLFASLMPDGHLQERTLNVETFVLRYGPYFIDWIYDSIDLEERDHRLLYL
ncbi:MAG: bacillithiol biosynthesis cysteine-adding enzyme BshC [Acidobacteria bacterium]|nr:MAG: bacillithiol biosynthesis cysteine-adding enzyme BshC [Acidobacteriota bacterium]